MEQPANPRYYAHTRYSMDNPYAIALSSSPQLGSH